MSATADAMNAIKIAAKQLRGGRYFVKRGFIDWRSFPFEQRRFGISILIDEQVLLSPAGWLPTRISFEIFTLIPEDSETIEIDDLVMDEFRDDARELVQALEKARTPDREEFPVAFKVDYGSGRTVESHDADLRIQGLICTFSADL